MKRSKVTDYAALTSRSCTQTRQQQSQPFVFMAAQSSFQKICPVNLTKVLLDRGCLGPRKICYATASYLPASIFYQLVLMYFTVLKVNSFFFEVDARCAVCLKSYDQSVTTNSSPNMTESYNQSTR